MFWVHPANVESLMCAAFNKEPLTAFGLLAMLLAHQRKRWGLACAGFAVALLSKETGAIALALVILLDICEGGFRTDRPRLLSYACYSAVLLAYLLIRFVFLPGPVADMSLPIPASQRLFYALGAWMTAVRVFFIPARLRLEYFAVPAQSPFDWIWRASVGGALAVLAAIGGWILWKRDRKLAFFWIWPFPFLLAVSNLLPTGAVNTRIMAERWLYVPYIGWFAVLGFFLCKKETVRSRIIGAAFMSVLAAASFARAADWSDEISLWRGLAQIYPWSAKAEAGLGEAYARADRCQEALPEFNKALTLRDGRKDLILRSYVPLAHGLLRWEDPGLYRWMGQCYASLGDLQKAESFFQKSVSLDPHDGFSYRVMALSAARAGKPAIARRWIEQGLERDPGDPVLLQLDKLLR